MGVVTKYSSAITNRDATPRVMNSANLEKAELRRSVGFAVIATGDSTGSKYLLGQIRSNDIMDRILVYSPDMGTTTTADLGLYRTTEDGGAVVDVDHWCSALSLKDGALNGSDITYEATSAGGAIANGEKRVWECLGLSTDPGLTYDVVLTLTGDADTGGTALFKFYIVSGN